MTQTHRAKRRSIPITSLSGNEIFCLNQKGLHPGPLVVGNSVQSLGYINQVMQNMRLALGGESQPITQTINQGRRMAIERLTKEALDAGAVGVSGVGSGLRHFEKNIEFVSTGSSVLLDPSRPPYKGDPFTSSLDGRGLYCLIDCSYKPRRFVFGNIAYSLGMARNWIASFKKMFRGGIKEFSDVMNKTRHASLERIVLDAQQAQCNVVLGIEVEMLPFYGFHEMLMTGTACKHPLLPLSNEVYTCGLTPEELWSATHLGYQPLKLVMATSIYSLGAIGGMVSSLKSVFQGEVSNLTSLLYEAREAALDMMEEDAKAAGADIVMGAEVRIHDLGEGLVEFIALGSAMKKNPDFKTTSEALPSQAVSFERSILRML